MAAPLSIFFGIGGGQGQDHGYYGHVVHDSSRLPMAKTVRPEPKKGRHLSITDEAYRHLSDISHEARLSHSETVERLIRSTPIWEGSATLSDGAFDLIEDYSVSRSSSPEDDESFPA